MYDETTTYESDTSDAGFRIDPVLARSWLLVNGAHYGKFEAASRSRADIVVLDIEDAVAPKDKVAARDNVVRWLGPKDAPAAGAGEWVRINGFGTPWWADGKNPLDQFAAPPRNPRPPDCSTTNPGRLLDSLPMP